MLGRLLQDIRPAKIPNNTRAPSGARALLKNFCRAYYPVTNALTIGVYYYNSVGGLPQYYLSMLVLFKCEQTSIIAVISSDRVNISIKLKQGK